MANSKETLHLFRVKVLFRTQGSVLRDTTDKTALLHQIVSAAPRRFGQRRVVWHIGNVENVRGYGLYFRIGKTTKAREAQFDERTKTFIDSEVPVAPYSHAILAIHEQVCGITANPKLAPSVEGVARQLERLLNSTHERQNQGVDIEVAPIPDPTEFVHIVDEAYQVSRFTIEFGRPNPIDANRDFQLPMERLLAEIGGDEGKTTVTSSEDLNRSVVEELARSAATTGNNAKIRVKQTRESKPVVKSLSGNAAQVQVGDLETESSKSEAAEKIISEYLELRRGDQSGTG